MFIQSFPKKNQELLNERKRLVSKLDDLVPGDAEYDEIMKYVERLSAVISKEMTPGINPNTILIIVGNLLIARQVINFEQTNVITTKLFSFLGKATI